MDKAELNELIRQTSHNIIEIANAHGGKTPIITGNFRNASVVFFGINVPPEHARLTSDIITSQLRHATELIAAQKLKAKPVRKKKAGIPEVSK